MKKKLKELEALKKILKLSAEAGASIHSKRVYIRQDGTPEYRMFIDFNETKLNIWTDDAEIINMLNMAANQKAR